MSLYPFRFLKNSGKSLIEDDWLEDSEKSNGTSWFEKVLWEGKSCDEEKSTNPGVWFGEK